MKRACADPRRSAGHVGQSGSDQQGIGCVYGRLVIIGVDESGNFSHGTRSLFVGVYLRPSERDRIVEDFKAWERSVRRALSLKNELKGHSVTDEWAYVLVHDVLANTSHYPVRYLAFGVDMNDATYAAMHVQREVFVESYERWAAAARDADNLGAARGSEEHGTWVRTRSDVQLLKLVMLGTVITPLLEWAMPQAILNSFDRELEHLKVMVDRGYVKHDDLSRWSELLRNAIINESQEHPLTTLDTWSDDHPFLTKFIAKGGNGPTLLTPAFRETINFYDSEATPEVRLADVVTSLVYRAEVMREPLPSYSELRELALGEGPYTMIAWTTNRRAVTDDPYAAFGE